QQHDPRAPHMFLGAVPIRDDRFKTSTIGGFHIDGDPGAHPADSHDCDYTGILSRTLPSDFIHYEARQCLRRVTPKPPSAVPNSTRETGSGILAGPAGRSFVRF